MPHGEVLLRLRHGSHFTVLVLRFHLIVSMIAYRVITMNIQKLVIDAWIHGLTDVIYMLHEIWDLNSQLGLSAYIRCPIRPHGLDLQP